MCLASWVLSSHAPRNGYGTAGQLLEGFATPHVSPKQTRCGTWRGSAPSVSPLLAVIGERKGSAALATSTQVRRWLPANVQGAQFGSKRLVETRDHLPNLSPL